MSDQTTRSTSAPKLIPVTTPLRPHDGRSESAPANVSASPRRSNELPVVPGYRVRREVARGGMGVVYAAHDPTFEREVAIKVMHPGQDADRFVVESKVTARLPHPGIPPVYELGTLADGRPFLVMKLIAGHTFSTELSTVDRVADLPRLVSAFEQMCLTVGFAHSKGIIHRDLKPSNIMVGSFGEVLVLDWGLARSADQHQRSGNRAGVGVGEEGGAMPERSSALHAPRFDPTITGLVNGTPAYMAPEQARGEPIDARADVFALGGILAAILTGNPPFQGISSQDTFSKAARAELAECFTQLDTCEADEELIEIAKKCLAPEADDRFANGQDVAKAIAEYQARIERRLRQAERRRAVRRAERREQRKRRRVQLALAVLIVFSTVAIGGFLWYSDHQAGNNRLKDAERRLKDEEDRRGIEANLALAADLRRQFKFQSADAALAQAAALATSNAPDLLAKVEQARADLALVVRLDDIRYRKYVWIAAAGRTGQFHSDVTPPEYPQAFETRGLPLHRMDPAEAAAIIAASAVKAELLAAIDDWALLEPDAEVRNRLLEIARRADPDPWTDRLRDPSVWQNRDAISQLAEGANGVTVSPTTVSVLAVLMNRTGLNPVPVVSAARVKHPKDFELAFTLGGWHSKQKNRSKAIAAYQAALALRPENITSWNNLGNLLRVEGDLDGARDAFEEALRLNPDYSYAHANLGTLLMDKSDFDGAITSYRRAVTLAPQHAPLRNNLGLGLKARGDLEGAFAAFKEAIRLDGMLADAHCNLGTVLSARGDHEGAIREFKAALRLDPASGHALANLGNELFRKGDTESAESCFRAACRLDSTLPLGHGGLGLVLYGKGDFDGAITEFREMIRLKPKDPQSHNNLGNALNRKGDVNGAITAYREAIRLDPKTVLYHGNLAAAMKSKGDLAGTVAAFRDVVRLDPHSIPAHFELAVALENVGDLDGAIAEYREAARLNPTFARIHCAIGDALHKKGDVNGASVAYKTTLRLDPTDAIAYCNLATVLGRRGDVEGALSAIKESVRLDPRHALAWANLGHVHRARGDVAAAIAAYQEAVRLDPRFAFVHYHLAMLQYDRKRYVEAVASARAAVAADPQFSNAHAVLGLALQQSGDTSGARTALTEAVRLDKRWAPLLDQLPRMALAPAPREVNR